MGIKTFILPALQRARSRGAARPKLRRDMTLRVRSRRSRRCSTVALPRPVPAATAVDVDADACSRSSSTSPATASATPRAPSRSSTPCSAQRPDLPVVVRTVGAALAVRPHRARARSTFAAARDRHRRRADRQPEPRRGRHHRGARPRSTRDFGRRVPRARPRRCGSSAPRWSSATSRRWPSPPRAWPASRRSRSATSPGTGSTPTTRASSGWRRRHRRDRATPTRTAALALRLPLHGGFETMPAVTVDIPFIARHRRADRPRRARGSACRRTSRSCWPRSAATALELPYDRIARVGG